MRTDLKYRWPELLSQIQAPLEKELEQIQIRIDSLLYSDLESINEVIVHLFSKSGKMIRPTLLLLSADRKRATHNDLISCGAAIEVIHTASLVHDDSIDKSDYRRGIQTLNSKWDHKTSVIIGDYLLAQAFEEITRLDNIEIIRELSAACLSLARGEMRQMAMDGDLRVTEGDYFDFIREKTGSLFGAACAVASLLGQGADRSLFREFGMLFGMIFQITDDLLDYIGSSGEIGKPTGMDIRERKMTLPLIYAFSQMDKTAAEKVREAFSQEEIGEEDIEIMTELVIAYGGIDYAWSMVRELVQKTLQLVETIPGESAFKLRELVEIIVERDR